MFSLVKTNGTVPTSRKNQSAANRMGVLGNVIRVLGALGFYQQQGNLVLLPTSKTKFKHHHTSSMAVR